ncbi:MAG: efflux RND transporter periplasmic adaptor subunit, partial [Pseudomonadota bacterium]
MSWKPNIKPGVEYRNSAYDYRLSARAFAFFAAFGLACTLGLIDTPQASAQASSQRGDGPPPAAVVVDRVINSTMSGTTPILGRVVAQSGGVIAAQSTGPVASVRAKVGDRVAQGDVIASLDLNRLELEAALAKAEWDTAQADLAAARARHEQAELALARLTGLKGSAAFSQARFEDASTDVVRTRSEIASAVAETARTKASYDLAQLDVERGQIKAPYAGIITERLAEPGIYVVPGTPIATMLDISDLEIEADVPFNRIAGLNPGQTVMVRLNNTEEATAQVRAVIPQENPRTRTRLVRFILDKSTLAEGQELAVNASVTVDIPNNATGQALTVHKDGIVKTPTGAFAFVAVPSTNGGTEGASNGGTAGGTIAERREVVIGEAIGNRFTVNEGLALDDLVVIRGNERLRPGQAIQIPSEG